MTIRKKQMPVGQQKDIENSLASIERLEAVIDYIAVCDHPEIFDTEEDETNE